MSFGTTLKKIRLKHKDSLRGLAKKINLHFTFVDKVEKGTAPISNNFIERIVEVYPDEEKILKKEYLKENLPKVLGGLGIAIVSTPQGVITDKECRKHNVGGEVLCYVW